MGEVNPLVSAWFDRAEYDLGTAYAMLETKRYLYVLFCCQQTIEKMLKGLILQETGLTPPYSHHLTDLSKMLALSLLPEHEKLLSVLEDYYIGGRYRETLESLTSRLDEKYCTRIYRQTKEFLTWLQSHRK